MPAEDCRAGTFSCWTYRKDLERSLAFHRDIAGMTPGEIFHGESPDFDTLTYNPGERLRRVHLAAGPFMLQLLQYEARAALLSASP